VLQRKLLQPNHFTSTTELQRALFAFIAHWNQTAKPMQWSYTVAHLERKLGITLCYEITSIPESMSVRNCVEEAGTSSTCPID